MRVAATLSSLDIRFENLVDRLSAAQSELQQLKARTQHWLLVIPIGLSLIILWMTAGQVALFRLAKQQERKLMLKQLLLALFLTIVTVMIHAAGSMHVVLPMAGIWSKKRETHKIAKPGLLLSRMVSGLLLLNLLEMSIWAMAFVVLGILPDFDSALYYSLKSYTTVGYGDVLPPVAWRLIGPIEAAVGVLMLGWSTAFIVAAVQQIFANRRPRTDV